MPGFSDYELRTFARLDAEVDEKYDDLVLTKDIGSSRKRRVELFTNEHDKNEYYQQYNRFFDEIRTTRIIKAKKYLEARGYIVEEGEKDADRH